MYSAILKRIRDNGKQSWGRFTLYDEEGEAVFACDTLELPWRNNDPYTSCYPPGEYEVLRRWSNAHGWHFHVLVPNRAFRLFHSGNFAGSLNPKTKARDTKGCTLVGKGYADLDGDGIPDILRSAVTMDAFLKAVPGNIFRLTVVGPPQLA